MTTAKKKTEYEFCPVWEGGNGQIHYCTVARNEAEALNNLIDHDPILLAIGCTVSLMEPVDGCEIVALVPKDYKHGNDRRNEKILD